MLGVALVSVALAAIAPTRFRRARVRLHCGIAPGPVGSMPCVLGGSARSGGRSSECVAEEGIDGAKQEKFWRSVQTRTEESFYVNFKQHSHSQVYALFCRDAMTNALRTYAMCCIEQCQP